MPFGIQGFRRRKDPLEELTEEVQRGFPQDRSFEEDEQETPVFNRYLEEIQNAPNREDYEMGTGKKILAALAGGLTGFTSGAEKGAKVIEDIREGPYRRDLAAYKAKLEPLEKGVGFERNFGETLRKRTKDKADEAYKYADLDRKKEEALGKLNVMKQKATTAEELARIKEMEVRIEEDYKRSKAESERSVAGSRRISANADAARAGAYVENVGKFGNGQKGTPKPIPVKEQMMAEAVSAKDALTDMQREMPSVQGVSLDQTGNLVFPKGMVPQVQEKYIEIFNKLKSDKANERLGRTR